MKQLTVYNSEAVEVVIVINGNEDIAIKPKTSIQIKTNHSFNSDNFYVDTDDKGEWMVRYIGSDMTQLELYMKQYNGWDSEKSSCGSFEE